MRQEEKLIVVKNAVANVVRGSAAAIVALVVPPFLTRYMSTNQYGAWAIVLQLSAYVSYLDFGIQTAIGRYVAHAGERNDTEQRNRIVATAVIALSGAAVLALLLIGAVAAALPYLFQQLSPELLGQIRLTFLAVAGSMAVGLPASALNGIFLGIQRTEIPAVIIGGTRLLSAAAMILIARSSGSLVAMGMAMAAVNLLAYFLQFIAYRRVAGFVRLHPRFFSRAAGRELFDYCKSLTIWTFSMLLITGLDLTILGHFRFDQVAYYAVAASLVTFIAGLQGSVFNAMMPAAAVLSARNDAQALGRMVVTSTRYGMLLLLAAGLPLILLAQPLLRLWVGPVYAANAAPLLIVLVIANIVRLSALPYAVALVGTGEHRLVIVSPLVEAISNLAFSVWGAWKLGAIGVAGGTLLGAWVGLAGHFFYNMPRTKGIRFSLSNYIVSGLLRPLSCAVPLVALYVLTARFQFSKMIMWLGFAFTAALTIAVAHRLGLDESERASLRPGNLIMVLKSPLGALRRLKYRSSTL